MLRKSIYTKEQKQLQQLLRELRQEAGLRQKDLARRLGKHQSFVSKYESGERRLDIIELWHVCKALRIDLTQFATRLEQTLKN